MAAKLVQLLSSSNYSHAGMGPLKDIYLYRSIGNPCRHQSRQLFLCLYNYTVGSWQLCRQTSTAVYSRLSSYTDREKSSQLMTTAASPYYKDIDSLDPLLPSLFTIRRSQKEAARRVLINSQLCLFEFYRAFTIYFT